MMIGRRAIPLLAVATTLVALAGVPLGRWLDPTRRSSAANLGRRPPFVVPAFSFRDRGGAAVSEMDLRGRPWVAAFVLAACGRASAAVAETLADLAARAPDLQIVTFSLDDAGSFGATTGTARWRRLAAEPAPFFRLAAAMGLGASEADVVDGLSAPTRWFFLVDEDGVVRATFDAFAAADRARLAVVVAEPRTPPLRSIAETPPATTLERGDWPVPPFSYRDQDGRRLTNRDLLGHPWIADFVFTRCAGPCPTMTARLGDLRRHLPSANVRFVSFSVDPAHDTPPVLKAYAAHFGGDADNRWRLLSTDWPTIGPLAAAMHAIVAGTDAPDASPATIVHSDRFVLVDATGRVRASIDSGDSTALEWLATIVPALDQPNTEGH